MEIRISHCSTIDEDCPFFISYERGTCWNCSCRLDMQTPRRELDALCIDGDDQIPSPPPEWCPLKMEPVKIYYG